MPPSVKFARQLACAVPLALGVNHRVVADITADTVSVGARHASVAADAGGYRLDANGTTRTIARQALRSDTASALVDALFALAQVEADGAKTLALTDGAYNHGQPIACDCFVTGVKWPFVWTRDSAYSIDLALAWLDPARARRTLEFKLSDVREPSVAQGLYVVQDTGSGGSWPVSSDRVAWFLGARHLLDDPAFAATTWRALKDTLAQDREFVFDAGVGLYRGETSFLDWREQSYPVWTQDNVRFIAESFALSTNVLHYEALRLAVTLARSHGEGVAATRYQQQADALHHAIDSRFWRADRNLYMSYIGADGDPQTIEAYDLLGTALAILADIPAPERARAALAHYPTWPAGSPVIWPEHRDVAIYHNRAIWPFVSAYALRAARKLNDAPRIDHELRSILQGAALAGSNYENYELLSGAVHVEDGRWSGPVVNSPRQLWSIAAMMAAVVEGVFGVDGERVEPKIPANWLALLFADRDTIALHLPQRDITLRKPTVIAADDDLYVAGQVEHVGKSVRITLRGVKTGSAPLTTDAPEFAPDTPTIDASAPKVDDASLAAVRFWRDGTPVARWVPGTDQPLRGIDPAEATTLQTLWTTRVAVDSALESLPGPILERGAFEMVSGAWPRHWTPSRDGRFRLRLTYTNTHGPINTGVTAAVKKLTIACAGAAVQHAPLVMPHSVAATLSTAVEFTAQRGQACTFSLEQGFNMSFLSRNRLYTGERGGASGPLNEADYADLRIAPLP